MRINYNSCNRITDNVYIYSLRCMLFKNEFRVCNPTSIFGDHPGNSRFLKLINIDYYENKM